MKPTWRWKIEYEIPPLRAIYFAELDAGYADTEVEVRAIITKEQRNWSVRKIERVPVER